MHVSHFLLSLNPIYGGPTASVPVQCIGLSKEGVDVTLVTYTESRPFEKELINSGVKIVDFDRPISKFSQKLQIPLKKALSKGVEADIFHYHGVWMPGDHWVSRSARKLGKKTVLNPRGDLEIARINYNRWKKIKKQIVWWLYGKNDTQKAACIIATSEQEKQAVRTLGISAPVAIIPNGIETESFPTTISHEVHDKKTILFLSRVNPIKGIEYLLEAWKSIPASERHDWQIHIAGNSDPKDYINELKKKVEDLDISDTVKFLGPITGKEKLEKYQKSDLFILPTLNENFGNVVAEAMMCELPVITTTNAPWKVLNDNKCGWWIELSVENLTNTLKEAMALSDEERWNLGRKGRQCIEQNFASAVVAKKTIAVYKWVLGQGEKPEFVDII